MFALWAAVAIAATPAEGLRIAAPNLSVTGVDQGYASVFTEYLGEQLEARGAEVITENEIRALIGIERQKQLMGCSEDEGSCMAELADALGAEVVLLGDVSKVGSVIQVNVKLLDAQKAAPLASHQGSLDREEDVFAELDRAAALLADAAARSTGRTLRPDQARLQRLQAAQSRRALRKSAWIPFTLGAVAAVAGGVSYGISQQRYFELTDARQRHTLANAASLRDSGAQLQALGVAGLGLAAAGLVTGGWMLWLGQEPSITPSVGVSSTGAAVMIEGSFE